MQANNSLFALFFCLLMVACSNGKKTTSTETSKNPKKEERRLVWSDEFNYNGLPNPEKWTYDVGDACDKPAGCGWGNQEKQYYTEKDIDNAKVENGHLIITAIKENPPKGNYAEYTSARLVTKGLASFKYGRVEARAKLPGGRGTWAAIWMLPEENKYGGWPKSGEIDIMENVGHTPQKVHGTVHTAAYNFMEGTQQGGDIKNPTASKAFHTYAIEWDEMKIEFYQNDQLYFTFHNDGSGASAWPFDQAFHLILNLAVGGSWGGQKGIDEDIWPQKMMVDYVRVYE